MSQNKEQNTLKFGTSGLRDRVEHMTDRECYINARGFISFLLERGELSRGGKIALAGDRRPSTPRIMAAVHKAILDSGCQTLYCGLIPSPALANFAIFRGVPSVMVTGSHIPADRNGIKFTKRSGEVLKDDEDDILRNVKAVRAMTPGLFDDTGAFLEKVPLPAVTMEKEAEEAYIKRYTEVFPPDMFKGRRIVVYEHSAVGRDMLKKVLSDLGAEVIGVGRSGEFVPVDTEKVSEDTRSLLSQWAEEHKPFAIVSMDGDSDRPLVADEQGVFLPGDKLGALVCLYLKPDFAAIPISANDAVVSALEERGIRLRQTKIGSPYVIKAMLDELGANPASKVVSWESNGGFLLGSDTDTGKGVLKSLPTRDAVLPIICVLVLAMRSGRALSGFIKENLPARFTYADVVDDRTEGCGTYTAEMGKKIIRDLSPANGDITRVEVNNGNMVANGTDAACSAGLLYSVARLNSYFTCVPGLGDITAIDFTDGIRIMFESGDVCHLRPSGNAPEFRVYATSDTEDRAKMIVSKRGRILVSIINDMSGKVKHASAGAQAYSATGADEAALKEIVLGVRSGKPVYLMPYEEPKVWGIGGIGEYWYGAEAGEKSSIARIGAYTAPMAAIFSESTEEVLGKDVIEHFGNTLPLVKILTPKGRLSLQFHDAKNELWIITGIDTSVAGKEPSLIVGFSEGSVEKYGGSVTRMYGLALLAYGKALNELIDILEEEGCGTIMEDTGDVILAAKRVLAEKPSIGRYFENVTKARKDMEVFYNYRKVNIGDVIPIPAGTLHALGPGIEIVEPQIPGPTQSLEDGATYPVRYYFPGYERKGAQKKLDVDRVNEMTPGIAGDMRPETVYDQDGRFVEKLPGGFEDKGLQVHRVCLEKGCKLELGGVNSFHTLVTVHGKASVVVGEKAYDIPKARPGGEMLLVPASSERFILKAEGGRTEIIDTFSPA
ncbi:MAG: hypothetical protein PHH49_05880 [Candidatus Omnitrophica bacterium]|nr:hypothetical protein [Candidatus Omnitrophota bacterium]MDD5488471.1 hypothetical protein [Candidatus Omnitrophota bacterium]